MRLLYQRKEGARGTLQGYKRQKQLAPARTRSVPITRTILLVQMFRVAELAFDGFEVEAKSSGIRTMCLQKYLKNTGCTGTRTRIRQKTARMPRVIVSESGFAFRNTHHYRYVLEITPYLPFNILITAGMCRGGKCQSGDDACHHCILSRFLHSYVPCTVQKGTAHS